MKLLIGGDIAPTESNRRIFCHPEQGELVDEGIQNLLEQADYRVFNLEVPLTNSNKKIAKFGPNLSAEKECVRGLQKIGVDFVTLANNHILDFGEEGLYDTMDVLRNAGIAFAGAGDSLCAAATPFFIDLGDCRIGIYCCAEHEFSVAGENTPGANPFDPLESLDHIAVMKRECDYLLVLYHGGKEFYRYPSPGLKKTCEKCVEKGADLVICQHSHCIGSTQKYKNGTIVYGQGNFLFDKKSDEFWNTGLLIGVEIEKNQFNIHYYPILKETGRVRLAKDEERKAVLTDFYKRSEEIEDTQNLENLYAAFAESRQSVYYKAFIGKQSRHFGFRILKRLFGERILKNCFSDIDRLRLLNFLECEAHRELMIRFLKNGEKSG